MNSRYLLHFAHDHLSFRWTEFLALASKYGCNFGLVSSSEHIKTRPYIIIELSADSSEDSLIQSAKDSCLMKGLYELWAQSNKSLEDLASQVANSCIYMSKLYHEPHQSFRVDCESFGEKLSQSNKVEMIKKMTFLEEFQARPNLKEPKQSYCIFEMYPGECKDGKEYFFGRLLTKSGRYSVDRFSLKTRKFIANTSMDPLLSFVSANAAKVKEDDVVYDPFVGSGSLLVAAAHRGAFVLGSDIDWKLMHGQSKPSRKGQKQRQEGENVRANLRQYDLGHKYIDVMVSDISRCPLHMGFKIDSVISDPPYGVRECSEKIGKRGRERKPEDTRVRYPSKVDYEISELLDDLLSLSAKHLVVGGRLVYYLPIIRSHDVSNTETYIPRHPCLELSSFCEQGLTGKVSRLMVVMEKTKEPEVDDKTQIPEEITQMNLRSTYFNGKNGALG